MSLFQICPVSRFPFVRFVLLQTFQSPIAILPIIYELFSRMFCSRIHCTIWRPSRQIKRLIGKDTVQMVIFSRLLYGWKDEKTGTWTSGLAGSISRRPSTRSIMNRYGMSLKSRMWTRNTFSCCESSMWTKLERLSSALKTAHSD